MLVAALPAPDARHGVVLPVEPVPTKTIGMRAFDAFDQCHQHATPDSHNINCSNRNGPLGRHTWRHQNCESLLERVCRSEKWCARPVSSRGPPV
jgi:hypothetical protein